MTEPEEKNQTRAVGRRRFPNGVTVVTIIRFIRAYDCDVRIDDVAEYFSLEVEDIAAAVAFHSRNFDWVHPAVLAGKL